MGLRRRVASRVSARSRARKIDELARRLPAGSSVLVVGVSGASAITSSNMIERWLCGHCRTVGLAYDVPRGDFEAPVVRGDARRLPFADDSVDYVVSNAVIEHVGGEDGARAMIAESARVARRGWIHTTPNRRFVVETHTQVPFLHWAPRRHQARLFARLGYTFPPSRYWLFTPRTAAALAAGVQVHRSRLGMTLLLEGAATPARAGRP